MQSKLLKTTGEYSTTKIGQVHCEASATQSSLVFLALLVAIPPTTCLPPSSQAACPAAAVLPPKCRRQIQHGFSLPAFILSRWRQLGTTNSQALSGRATSDWTEDYEQKRLWTHRQGPKSTGLGRRGDRWSVGFLGRPSILPTPTAAPSPPTTSPTSTSTIPGTFPTEPGRWTLDGCFLGPGTRLVCVMGHSRELCGLLWWLPKKLLWAEAKNHQLATAGWHGTRARLLKIQSQIFQRKSGFIKIVWHGQARRCKIVLHRKSALFPWKVVTVIRIQMNIVQNFNREGEW